MGCFSLAWIEQLCVYLIVACAVIAIIRVVVPWGLSGLPGPVVAIINIVLWAIVAIFVVYLIFALLSCLVGGGLHFFPHR